MKNATGLLFLILTLFWTHAVGAPPQLPKPAADAIDSFVRKSIQARGTPGLTLAITTDQFLLHVGTYGYSDLKTESSVTKDTQVCCSYSTEEL
jgi:CubicO group peptidase (beta-lactamase class C family)